MTDSTPIAESVQTAYYVLAIFFMLGGAVAAYCRSLHNKIEVQGKQIDAHGVEFLAYKVYVAQEYLSTTRFDLMTKQITDSINRLGDRIDALFNGRPASHGNT